MQSEQLMDRLVEQYEGYFDITRPFSHNGRDFLAYAHYYQMQEKYVLVRRAKMYGFEINEHVFFVSSEHLTDAAWAQLKSFIIEAEKDFVKPHREHMYSYMSLQIIADSIDESVKENIKRTKYTKNYKFAMQGYSTVRVGALDLSDKSIITNRQGKEMKKVLERALHA